jgi:hypothetical protein
MGTTKQPHPKSWRNRSPGINLQIGVRCEPKLLAEIDAWRRSQSTQPAEAMRCLIELSLAKAKSK